MEVKPLVPPKTYTRTFGTTTYGTLAKKYYDDVSAGLSKLLAGWRGDPTEGFRYMMAPNGYYSGLIGGSYGPSNRVITNPWGTYARTGLWSASELWLKPGQSYNFMTGAYSDPNLHPETAKRLNAQIDKRAAQAEGFGGISRDSSRGAVSVLSTIDQVYFASQLAKPVTGSELGGLAQAQQGGLESTRRTTLLGAASKKQVGK